MANTVTLTFAGETKSAEDAFSRVGGAARDMGRQAGEAATGFDRAGEAADNIDTKAMGFRDTITGLHDLKLGLRGVDEEGKKVGLEEQLMLIGFGVGDLASGFFNLLIPQLKSAVTWLGQTKVGTLAAAAASKVATAAQWLWNFAMTANPIGIIIVAVAALIAIIVLIATKTTWFQDLWKWVWSKIGNPVKAAWAWIKDISVKAFNWITGLPGKIGAAFGKVKDFISAPFKAGFNMAAKAWNNTIGKLSWTVPSWVPGIGGNSISVPKLPTFHAGGRVPGAPGQNVLAVLQAGEEVSATGGPAASRGGPGGTLRVIVVGGDRDAIAYFRRLQAEYGF